MKQHARARSIGIFVSLALLMLVAGVAMLTSGTLFEQRDRFSVVFDGSIKGLNVGSRVTIQGVPSGQVTDIDVVYLEEEKRFVLPVHIEVTPVAIRTSQGERVAEISRLHQTVIRETKARLVPQSLVTGQLMIELVVDSTASGRLLDVETEYEQIPLLPSQFDEAGAAVEDILRDLQALNLEQIGDQLSDLLSNINALVTNPEIPQMLAQLSQASGELNQLLANLNQQVPALTQQLDSTLQSVERTATSFDKLAQDGDTLVPHLHTSLDQLEQTLQQAGQTMQSYQQLVADDSELRFQINQSLGQMQRTLYSVNELTEQLERQPESVIFGKQEN